MSEAADIMGAAELVNEAAEIWSLPWHALQRALAAGASANASGSVNAGGRFAVMQTPEWRFPSVFVATAPARTWLGRAHTRTVARGPGAK